MILLVTCQWAGGEYLLPLVKRWRERLSPDFLLMAEGPSVAFWEQAGVPVLPSSRVALGRCLQQRKVDLVLASASSNSALEREAVRLGRKAGVPTAQFIDMWVGYANRFIRSGEPPLHPDTVLAIDDTCKREMIDEGISAERIRIVGQPAWEAFLRRADCGPQPNEGILLASQPIEKYYGKSLGYTETTFYASCLEAVEAMGYKGPVRIRTHPEETFDPTCLPRTSCAVDIRLGLGPRDVLENETVLGMFSTQLILGHLAGRRVASVQPGISRPPYDLSPLSRWGRIPLLRTSGAVAEFLAHGWVAPTSQPDLREQLSGSLDALDALCMGHAYRLQK